MRNVWLRKKIFSPGRVSADVSRMSVKSHQNVSDMRDGENASHWFSLQFTLHGDAIFCKRFSWFWAKISHRAAIVSAAGKLINFWAQTVGDLNRFQLCEKVKVRICCLHGVNLRLNQHQLVMPQDGKSLILLFSFGLLFGRISECLITNLSVELPFQLSYF